MLHNLITTFWDLLKIPFYVFAFVVLFFYVLVFLHIFYQFIFKKKRPKKAQSVHKFKRHPLKAVFYDFPKQIALDFFSRNPDAFPYQGVIIFEGRQGYGKTISMMEYARFMQKKYPLSKCCCNINYDLRDSQLTDWKQLLSFVNGEYGVIDILDEMQNWFNSKDSKDFPPEMLSVVTQNRKNRRIILGTAQQFYMLAKDIRTQCTEVRSCRTFLGCLTFVVRREPHVESDGTITGYTFKGIYFFAHTPELRNSYDTYEVVNRAVEVGYQERRNVDLSVYL